VFHLSGKNTALPTFRGNLAVNDFRCFGLGG
jgi:hypothetical protein